MEIHETTKYVISFRGMTSALESTPLVEYFQYLHRAYDEQLPIKRGVVIPDFRRTLGKQVGTLWIPQSCFVRYMGSSPTLKDLCLFSL